MVGLIPGIGVFAVNVAISTLFDPLIISVTFLFQAIICSLLVWLIGIESFPGAVTWIGTFITIAGMVMIVFGQNQIDPAEENNDKQPLDYELFETEQQALDNHSKKLIQGK